MTQAKAAKSPRRRKPRLNKQKKKLAWGGMSAERRKNLHRYEKRFEKGEKKIRKTIQNVFENFLAPLRPLKNISPALFNKFQKFFTSQNLHKRKSFFFTARLCRGSHTKACSSCPYHSNFLDYTTPCYFSGFNWCNHFTASYTK